MKKIDEWERKGYISKGYAKHLFTPVIVPKRGSKDKFRVCFNFQPLNEVIEDEYYQAKDADQIVAQMGEAKFICIVDMPKAH